MKHPMGCRSCNARTEGSVTVENVASYITAGVPVTVDDFGP